ncbi:hypothetical protein QTP88_024781 [Uroleucon formosanum]
MEHPVYTIYVYKLTHIRALKVFLVFRGAWVAFARRLRGWFGTPVRVRVGYGGGERVRCGRLSYAYNCMGYVTVQSDGGGGVVGSVEGGCGGGGGVVAGVCSALDGGVSGVPFAYDSALPRIE